MFKQFNAAKMTIGGSAVSLIQVNLYDISDAAELDNITDEYVTGNVTVSVDSFDATAYGDGHIEHELQRIISDELGVACDVSWSEDGLQSEDDCYYDFDIEINTTDLMGVIDDFEE